MSLLKIYVAGKAPEHAGDTPFWRGDFCRELEQGSGVSIMNLDPTTRKDLQFDPTMIFGRDSFLIKSADLVIVNLTDEMSIGAAIEMLIAKYFGRPLLGIAARGGKFINANYNDLGRVVDFIHPFAFVPCDAIVNNMNEAADWIRNDFGRVKPKDIRCVDQSIRYYFDRYLHLDTFVRENLGETHSHDVPREHYVEPSGVPVFSPNSFAPKEIEPVELPKPRVRRIVRVVRPRAVRPKIIKVVKVVRPRIVRPIVKKVVKPRVVRHKAVRHRAKKVVRHRVVKHKAKKLVKHKIKKLRPKIVKPKIKKIVKPKVVKPKIKKVKPVVLKAQKEVFKPRITKPKPGDFQFMFGEKPKPKAKAARPKTSRPKASGAKTKPVPFVRPTILEQPMFGTSRPRAARPKVIRPKIVNVMRPKTVRPRIVNVVRPRVVRPRIVNKIVRPRVVKVVRKNVVRKVIRPRIVKKIVVKKVEAPKPEKKKKVEETGFFG